MSTQTLSPTDFVASLELAEPRVAGLTPHPVRFRETGDAGYVDDGSLVSFVAGTSEMHQSDVLNSCLLAQLAANQKYNRETQTVEWYAFYRTVLENVGWVIQSFDFTRFSASGSSISVDAMVIAILGAIATGSQLGLARATIAALQALPDDDRAVKLFETSSHTLDKGSFQIGLAKDEGGPVVMTMGAFYFSTSETVTRLFGWKFSDSNTSFYQGTETVTLDEQVYAQVRQQIIDKLGDKARIFVAALDIG